MVNDLSLFLFNNKNIGIIDKIKRIYYFQVRYLEMWSIFQRAKQYIVKGVLLLSESNLFSFFRITFALFYVFWDCIKNPIDLHPDEDCPPTY